MELVFAVGTVLSAGRAGDAGDANAFVRVSPRDARYFELTDGRPYVPVGLNMLGPRNWKDLSGEQCVAQLDAWMGKLAANGGNFARVWLSYPCWDVECVRSGQYEEDKARRIDALLAATRKHGIRLKLCLEHFREINPAGAPQPWATKAIHHVSGGGRYRSMAELLDSDAGRRQFKAKLAWLARRFGQRPEVFGWELWNEMDCVRGGRWEDWTAEMLGELHRLLSRNLAMQSLGSYDDERKRDMYRRVVTMKGNDVAQVHRYLDCGARWEICRGPVDVLAADAVREMLAFKPARPVLLAESGAVEPRHSGPFKLYGKDTAGIILHDVLFAPFFAGAAGSGHCWH